MPIVASPVKGCSVIFRISPVDIDRWVSDKALHKFKIARGAGIPQLLLFG